MYDPTEGTILVGGRDIKYNAQLRTVLQYCFSAVCVSCFDGVYCTRSRTHTRAHARTRTHTEERQRETERERRDYVASFL
jgi:hypothetical protein